MTTTTKFTKEINRFARLVMTIQKSIDARQASWDSGEYATAFSDIGAAEMMFVANQVAANQHLATTERGLAAAKLKSVA